MNTKQNYPWLFFQMTPSWLKSFLTGLLVSALSILLYVWYTRYGNDPTPDSILGYAYAIAGSICLVLAAVLYTLRRRARKRAMGQLNAALNWHICFAVVGLVLLLMHSFGNLNPRSGTYALYGMIALAISGFVGRALDHFMPRLIALEVSKALTAQGEDRIETISQKLRA